MVYHTPTGSTHLIDGMGVALFEFLVTQSASQSELVAYLPTLFELPSDFDVETFLGQLITDYHALGLLTITENCAA